MKSKKALLSELRLDVVYNRQGTYYERVILRENTNVRDIKDALKYEADKLSCIRRQIEKTCQWYLGELYCYDQAKVDGMWEAIFSIANKLGYEIYSPNGAWFVRAIK